MAQYRLVLSAGGHDEADSKLSMWDGAKLAAKDWVRLSAFRSIANANDISSHGSSCFYTFS
jgi:hypothetical protein